MHVVCAALLHATWLSLALSGVVGGGWPGERRAALDALGSPDRERRLAALERLADDPDARPALRALFDDRDAHVRQGALRLLVAMRDEVAVATAVTWASAETAIDRQHGLEALRLLPVLPEAGLAAIARALVDPDATVRSRALDALAGQNAGPLLPRLTALLDDGTPSVRLRAVRLLGAAADPRALLPLVGRLDDADKEVQRGVIAALGATRDARALPALLRVLETGSADTREVTLGALAALGARAAVPAIVPLARAQPFDPVAARAQRALGELGGTEAAQALVGLLRAPGPSEETREALIRMGADAVPAIVELLAEDDAAAEAARLLGRLGDPRAVGPLLGRLGQRDEAFTTIIAALGALEARAAVAAIGTAAADPSQTVRRSVCDALVAIADPRAAVYLPGLLADADPRVRVCAVRLAGVLRTRDAHAAVTRALRDEERDVRTEALRALGAIGSVDGEGTTASLLAALAGVTDSAALAEVLTKVAGPHDARRLVAAAKASRGAVRAAVVAGLGAALSAGRVDERAVADEALAILAADLAHPGEGAERAADALSSYALRTGRAPAELPRLFELVSPEVRARLCLARRAVRGGNDRLRRAVADRDEDDEVRAAAAWALAGARGDRERRALKDATAGAHPAVAANARAALAARAGDRFVSLRLVDRGGRASARSWVTVATASGEVWTRSGGGGWVRVNGLVASAATVRLVASGGALETTGNRARQIARHDPP